MRAYQHDWLKSLDARAGGSAASSAPSTRATSRRRSSKGAAGRPRHHLLHLRHHRQPQGRHAHPRQRASAMARELRSRGVARSTDDYSLAYLPMAWVGDALYTLVHEPRRSASACNCPESPETVQRDLRELGPTDAPGAAAHLGEHADRGAGARRRRPAAQAPDVRLLPRAWPSARRSCAPTASPCPLGLRLATALGEFFVYGPVRDQLGLRRARWALTGGAPLGPDTFRFFRSIGVNLKQVYGSTETTGLVSLQPDARGQSHHGGPAVPGHRGARSPTAARCSCASRGVFQGYLKNDEATREVIDADGLVPHRRRRLHRPARAPRHHRPRQGRRRARRRHALRAAVHREQAQVQPVHPRGGGLRQRAAVRDGHDRHRHRARSGNWAERRGLAYTSYMDLTPEGRRSAG